MYSEIIASLARTSSRLEKESILGSCKDEEFKELLSYTYDPFKMFGVKQIPEVTSYGNGSVKEGWGEIKFILDKLIKRELTGNRALDIITSLLSSLTAPEAELLSNIIRKDLRCGISVKTANKVFPKLIPTFELMLAAQEKDSKVQYRKKRGAYAEVKKDGLRCAAIYDGENVMFLSRGGKPFDTLYFLEDEVIKFLNGKPGFLDGEICGDNFNETVSGVKRDVENEFTRKVKYVIYDHLFYDEWINKKTTRIREHRVQELDLMFFGMGPSKHLEMIQYWVIHSEEEARDLFNQVRAKGEEGLVLKDMDNIYEFKRSRTISKMKPSETMDLEIIGFEEGSGKYVGMLGALIVDYKGKPCRIGTGFKDSDRKWLWDNRPIVLGQLCECTFMEETSSVKENSNAGGSTRHAVYHGLRSFKGDKV